MYVENLSNFQHISHLTYIDKYLFSLEALNFPIKASHFFFLGSIRQILPVLIEIHDVHFKKKKNFSVCLEEKGVFRPTIAHS